VPRLRRSGFFLPVSPALTGWANLCRAYGASDCRCYLYPALTGWANLCRAYGASDCRCYLYPALAGWANLCRAYGASDCRCYLYPALTGWANLCRAYGASDCRCYLSQPLRAGLTYVAPTALFGSENSSQLEPPKRPGKLILVLTRRLLSW